MYLVFNPESLIIKAIGAGSVRIPNSCRISKCYVGVGGFTQSVRWVLTKNQESQYIYIYLR